MRGYVVESLRLGVLVAPEGMELEVLSLPEPGEEKAGPDEPEGPSAVPVGLAAREKRAIQARLKAYRRAHGLGCFATLAEGGLSEDVLRDLAAGLGRYSLDVWREAGRALDWASMPAAGEVSRNEP